MLPGDAARRDDWRPKPTRTSALEGFADYVAGRPGRAVLAKSGHAKVAMSLEVVECYSAAC